MEKSEMLKKIDLLPQIEENNKKLRPCCACPETRKIRDKCIFEKGEEKCDKFIEDHRNCLRSLGFEIN
jgi:cytochrome c oxidase assembly protein subunit 17